MGDIVLSWAVVIAPTLFAVVLETVDESIRKNNVWKCTVIGFGVGLSVLTFWQQYRSTKNAERDLTSALQSVAPKVAAETSTEVTSTLNREYGSVITDLYRQLAEMQTQERGRLGLAKKQFALEYAPSLDLIYVGDQLQLWNRGKANVYLWGNSYKGNDDLVSQPMTLSPASSYYLLSEELGRVIHNTLGENGEERVPFDLYLSLENKDKFVMHTTIWEIVKDGKITIHTQNHGYEKKDWSKPHS